MKQRYRELLKQVETDRRTGLGTHKNSHVLVIDGLNTFIRVFSAVPALNDDGDHIGGVTGFLRSVALAIRQIKPTRCIIVFDGKGGSQRRKNLYPEYKSNRANKTAFNRYKEFASLGDEQESMRHQYSRIIQYLDMLPVTLMCIDQVEADDVMAYIATTLTGPDERVTMVSTDRDFMQLVDDRVSVWSPVKKKLYTPESMLDEFAFPSVNYLLYRTFIGDKSDNINGINGVGQKTLIKHFPMIADNRAVTIDEVIEHAREADKRFKVYETVQHSRDQLELNWKLMQLKEPYMDGRTMSLVRHLYNEDIAKINVFEFKKMFMADKLYTVIKDADTWLSTSFNSLNVYASL
jgi:DNA polymerase-1